MITYYTMYRFTIYRHRFLAAWCGQPYRSHDRFVYHCYYWWLR